MFLAQNACFESPMRYKGRLARLYSASVYVTCAAAVYGTALLSDGVVLFQVLCRLVVIHAG